jgi:hypothetical protein
MKLLVITAAIALLFTGIMPSRMTKVLAQALPIPATFSNSFHTPKKIEKIVITPVQRKQMFNYTSEQYAQEIAYYFHRNGFSAPPISHILFEKEYLTVNKDWFTNQFSNNTNKKTIFALLVYENTFSPAKFTGILEQWRNEIIIPALKYTGVTDIKNIEYRSFTIEPGETPKIVFTNLDKDPGFAPIFSSLDFKTKEKQKLEVAEIPMPEVEPNSTTNIQLQLKNTSPFDLVLGDENTLQLKFKKDSAFFVNDKWLNKKSVLLVKEGIIKIGETKNFNLDLYAPLLPGKIEEDLVIQLGENEVTQYKVSMNVKDVGQKLLKITYPALDSLVVRSQPDARSSEVGKTGNGQIHLYNEFRNGYYRIQISDKEGWIPMRNAQLLNKPN